MTTRGLAWTALLLAVLLAGVAWLTLDRLALFFIRMEATEDLLTLLDPLMQQEVYRLLRQARSDGSTVFFSYPF